MTPDTSNLRISEAARCIDQKSQNNDEFTRPVICQNGAAEARGDKVPNASIRAVDLSYDSGRMCTG